MGKNKNENNKKLAYIFLEGETENIFYKEVFNKYLKGVTKNIKNLKTGSGINKQILSELYYFLREKKNKEYDIYVYAFIDREGTRSDVGEFNGEAILKELKAKQIKAIKSVEAIIRIESWFFYDLENICNYIGLECTESIKRTYCNPEKLTHKDLERLFHKGNKKKHYKKGEEGFLKCLDIDKIYKNCKDLKTGLDSIDKDMS